MAHQIIAERSHTNAAQEVTYSVICECGEVKQWTAENGDTPKASNRAHNLHRLHQECMEIAGR